MLLRSSLSLTFNFRKLVQSDSELGTVLKEPNSSSFTTAEPNVFKLVLPRHRICAEMQTRVQEVKQVSSAESQNVAEERFVTFTVLHFEYKHSSQQDTFHFLLEATSKVSNDLLMSKFCTSVSMCVSMCAMYVGVESALSVRRAVDIAVFVVVVVVVFAVPPSFAARCSPFAS